MTVTVVGLLLLIAVGAVVIHRLNVQHGERIAGFHYSDAVPGTGRRTRRSRGPEADETTTVEAGEGGAVESDRGGQVAAIMRERQTHLEKVMRALYRTAATDRLGGADGVKLRKHLGMGEQDFADACGHLADEGRVVVERGPGGTPALIRLTPREARRARAGSESAAHGGTSTGRAVGP